MKRFNLLEITAPLLIFILLCSSASQAQTTEFAYQGSVNNGGAATSGNFDLEFRLFDAATDGTMIGSRQRSNVTVTNGVFNVVLDFGVFPPANRFLEIGIRPPGGSAVTTLAPRFKLLSTPYSTQAKNALRLGGVAANRYVRANDVRLSDERHPLPGSANYIKNSTSQQAADFNISGNGSAGGTMTANIVSATTEYRIGNIRVLESPGSFNFFAGNGAGQLNTTGSINSFFGVNSGIFNTTGSSNAFFGVEAGRQNQTGANNAYFGRDAGRLNTTGGSNSFFGMRAGITNTTGSNNTIVGNLADVGTNNLTNANAIGYKAFVENSNALVLGSVNGKNSATVDTNVGIGTTTPDVPLDIESQLSGTPNLRFTNFSGQFGGPTVIAGRSARGTRTAPTATLINDTLLSIDADGYDGSAFTGSDSGGATIQFFATENWSSNDYGTGIRFTTTPNGASFNLTRMTVNSDGFVSIGGVNTPAQKLDVTGNIRVGSVTGTNGCVEDRDGTVIAGTCSSDLRFKKNITPFGNILNNFSKLRPVNFYWRADEFAGKHFGDKQSFGLVAQEVEQLFPEMVVTDDQGFKMVNYSKLPLYTVQAVNELKAESDALRLLLRQQQEEINELRKNLEYPGRN